MFRKIYQMKIKIGKRKKHKTKSVMQNNNTLEEEEEIAVQKQLSKVKINNELSPNVQDVFL